MMLKANRTDQDHASRTKHILILVENLPVPFDRRVWQEATSLVQAGYEVSVICPRTRGFTQRYELLEGVHIYRHFLPLEASGIAGFFLEYASALVGELRLALKASRRRRIDAIQACNPPDLLFLVAAPFKLFGVRFVFDHHDTFPELFQVKFPRLKLLYRATRLAEWLTFRMADRVITTSDGLRRMTAARNGKSLAEITLVRSGPDLQRLRHPAANPALREGFAHVALYIGIIGQQDGLDLLMRAVAHLVYQLRRTDTLFIVVGDGPQKSAIEALASTLNIAPYLRFTGYLSGPPLFERLASADIGVCCDPKNAFNDKLSMNKVMEYMSFGLPVVQFDLTENRLLAGDASMYAGDDNDPHALAEAIDALLDDPQRRQRMGHLGRQRIESELAWCHQVAAYLRVYRELLGGPESNAGSAILT
ncbi:glycosyltransferase family 4 protein [uncultured Thiodictyon sp.]|uniref:glycosyltransferase family 4 protein n=1 Tax=uncultured Thiodictyon sp. TaxID=1846217 RepID=UPI0025D6A058|nr:glycosyltransferase family 4 protein [uncultured Thiodictyon sp.]